MTDYNRFPTCSTIALSAPSLILIGAAVCFALCIAGSGAIHSPTIDETAHLTAGVSHWDLGRFELYAVNPPLVRMIAALPVTYMNPNITWQKYSRHIAARSEFSCGRDFVRANGERAILFFRVARLAVLPIALLGGFVCLIWGSQASGFRVAGCVAAWLYFLSPTVLGNSAMVTPDTAAAVLCSCAVFRLSRWADTFHWHEAVLSGLVLGLAILSKFTALILAALPVLIIATHRRPNVSTGTRISHLIAIALITMVLVNLGFGFDGTGTPLGSIPLVSADWRGDSGTRGNRFTDTLVGSIPIPLPTCFVLGIDAQISDFERGFRSYLMGEWKHGGWWYYYIVGFLVKEPIGFQLMLYASILHGFWYWKLWTRESIREWSLIVTPPLLIFGLVSSQTGFNHHMRYVLPAYPFLFIIAARTVTLGKFWKWFSFACLTWQAAAVLWFAPHWLSYFNEAAGGPKNGHKWLVDSNIDWGQDILMLKWWQDKHPEAAPLNAALFTGFDPKDIGLKFKLPAPFQKGQPQIVSKDGLRGPQPGWYAISVCQLKGHRFSIPEGDGEWTWSDGHFTYFLDNFEPVDMIGYSIYIYHITEEDAARVRAKLLADEAEFLKAESGKRKMEGGGE